MFLAMLAMFHGMQILSVRELADVTLEPVLVLLSVTYVYRYS